MPLTINQLPSPEWWDFLREPGVRRALRRYELAIRAHVPCAPMDAVLAGLLEAWAPHEFVASARRLQPVDLREVAARAGLGGDVEDLVWQARVAAHMETAAAELGVLDERGGPGAVRVTDQMAAERRAEILAVLEEEEHRPGLPRPLSNRPSGRRRRQRARPGSQAVRRELDRLSRYA
jgi:hypothetical protein